MFEVFIHCLGLGEAGLGVNSPLSLTLIVLTYNEEIHIARCIESVVGVAEQIFVVDSFSSDKTCELAEKYGAVVVKRKFINQAEQLNWAINSLPIKTDWVLRLDADEYLEPELRLELKKSVPKLSDQIGGCYINRKVFFQGRWVKHGGFGTLYVLRLWKLGRARCEDRWMDEHMVLNPGFEAAYLKGSFIDDNLKGFTFWLEKINNYTTREAIELLNNKYRFIAVDNRLLSMSPSQVTKKRQNKENIYLTLPPVFRAFIYFIYRYIFQRGFLDGRVGSVFHIIQGLVYRILVDVKVIEIELRSGGDVNKILELIRDQHRINLLPSNPDKDS